MVTDRQLIDHLAEVADVYDRMYPGKPDSWQPCGVLGHLSIGDLRACRMSRDRAASSPEVTIPVGLRWLNTDDGLVREYDGERFNIVTATTTK